MIFFEGGGLNLVHEYGPAIRQVINIKRIHELLLLNFRVHGCRHRVSASRLCLPGVAFSVEGFLRV